MARGIVFKQLLAIILMVLVITILSFAGARFYSTGERFGLGLLDTVGVWFGLEVEPRPGRLIGVDFQLRGVVANPVVHAVLRVALPPQQQLVCGGEVQVEPHEESRNKIVECEIPLEPTDSYGTITFTAHTLIRGEGGGADQMFPLLEAGDRKVTYVSRTLTGITAADLVDDAVLEGPISNDLKDPLSEKLSGGRELCNYLGDSCSNVGHPLCTPEYSVEGVTYPNPMFVFLNTCPKDSTVRHCLDTVYLPALQEHLSLCDIRPGVWATNDHFIITGGAGGGYTHISPARRGFFVDESGNEVTSPVTTDEEIVPFVLLAVPDGETVERVTVEIISSQGYFRDMTLSYVFSPEESSEDYSGFGYDVYRADPLEDLPAGVYDVVLRVRDAHTVRVFDGMPLVVYRPLPFESIRLSFDRYPDRLITPPPENTPNIYSPDRIAFVPDTGAEYDRVSATFEVIAADRPLPFWIESGLVLDREILSVSPRLENHQAIARTYSGLFKGYEDYNIVLGIPDTLRDKFDHNEETAILLAGELGFSGERVLDDFNAWTEGAFDIIVYGWSPPYGGDKDGYFYALRKVVYPENMGLFLNKLESHEFDSSQDPLYVSLVPDRGEHVFDQDWVVLLSVEWRSDFDSDVTSFNPIVLDQETRPSVDCRVVFDDQMAYWVEYSEESCPSGSYCVPYLRLPTSEESTLRSGDQGLRRLTGNWGQCREKASRGMLVHNERICESGVTDQPVTRDQWARCV